jgi:tRNA(Ile)-lysidine synthase
MALLDTADRWARTVGVDIAVGHVDHGLRRKAGADARHVFKQARLRSRPCGILKAPARKEARRRGKGLEEAARHTRYIALARLARRYRCDAVLTAHTLNDQAETFFLNLLRGAGPAGLAAMAPQSPWPAPIPKPPALWRPFLGVTRSEVEAYLASHRVPFREDETNSQPLFLRNEIRPLLARWEELRPGFFHRVGRLAEILRDEEDFWTRRLARRTGTALDARRLARLHRAEQRRLLRLWARPLGLSFPALESLRDLALGRPGRSLDLPGGRFAKRGTSLRKLQPSYRQSRQDNVF